MGNAWTDWNRRLRLPVIAAPMTGVSGPDLVIEACVNGVIGSFPTQNTPTLHDVDEWLQRIDAGIAARAGELAIEPAPYAVNLVMRRDGARLAAEVDALVRHGVELVITSVGSPAPVLADLHQAGVTVLADVATLHHAERAVAAGADGLVLLTAGAGGQTGWMNPFAFVRAVRAWFDGPIVLAGGIADGASVWAALALGCDLAYIGTGFIPTREGLASAAYRQAVLAASLDDVELFMQDTGIPASMLRTAATPPPAERDPLTPPSDFSAGHSVSLTNAEVTVAELVARLRAEFGTARAASLGAA